MTLYLQNKPGKMPWWRHMLAMASILAAPALLFLCVHLFGRDGLEHGSWTAWAFAFLFGFGVVGLLVLFCWLVAPVMRPICTPPAVLECVRLWRELNVATVKTLGAITRAAPPSEVQALKDAEEVIRSTLDGLWQRMTDRERRWVRNLLKEA